jgi:hypothetical protein
MRLARKTRTIHEAARINTNQNHSRRELERTFEATPFLIRNYVVAALHQKSSSRIFLACEAGESIKPGALAQAM